MIRELFVRFPSFQKAGAGAYKPGTGNMEFFDQLSGHPHRRYLTIHVAGTNGKGSVSNMLASVLAASGLRVGLYTSPHILDFRERIRMADGRAGAVPVNYIGKEEVWDFVQKWNDTFDYLEMSFFEITTAMAFSWFAEKEVDVAVIETGLGGRLDSTNIITPLLSVITNIGYDHCDMLGDTLPEIAFEKAGIIKPEVPVIMGESSPDTDTVFEHKVLYTNLSSPVFMGDRNRIMSLLTFADKVYPHGWDRKDILLKGMDLQGEYQEKNLRTVLAALDTMRKGQDKVAEALSGMADAGVEDAVMHTAGRMDFHGRWEKLCDCPYVICDIGHNSHGLRYNFRQLDRMMADGVVSSLIIIYGTVADKDVESVFPLMPVSATYIFTNASGKRAMPAGQLTEKYMSWLKETGRETGNVFCRPEPADAVKLAESMASSSVCCGEDKKNAAPLIYIGGSTYVVSECAEAFGWVSRCQ